MQQFLDLVQQLLALATIGLPRLLLIEGVDVGKGSVGKGAQAQSKPEGEMRWALWR